jgi:hypothetical protein
MRKRPRFVRGQAELIPRSRRPIIEVDPSHPLVVLTDTIAWDELLDHVMKIRESKLASPAGRPPNLRATVGVQVLLAVKNMTYREAEDFVRYYAPARYLCGLTETDWTPDFTTMNDFAVLVGEEGLRVINEYAVKLAVELKLADPKLAVADTTAQEAEIPHPTEMGLMSKFLGSVGRTSQRAGTALKRFGQKIKAKLGATKKRIREHWLFAKTASARKRHTRAVADAVAEIQQGLGEALEEAARGCGRLRCYSKRAHARLMKLHEVMKRLLPQIRYWLRTGRVATGKIISLFLPELYAIVRGKVGKAVEFGLTWGITRLKGGYLLAHSSKDRKELYDSRYAVRAVKELATLFGQPPRAYAYDRGGYSKQNLTQLRALGVAEVGLAPRGRAAWAVDDKARKILTRERAKVEGGIGTIKRAKYGFNRPRARSVEMMKLCGQRAVLGFNLMKLVRELGLREAKAVA